MICVPPLNSYAIPGFCNTSFKNINNTSSKLIGLPAVVSILIGLLFSVIVNWVLLPLNSSEKSSRIWNLPRTHPANISSNVCVIVNVAGTKLVPALKEVGIPAIVICSPTVYPYPVLVRTGAEILPAAETLTDTDAPIPVPELVSLDHHMHMEHPISIMVHQSTYIRHQDYPSKLSLYFHLV